MKLVKKALICITVLLILLMNGCRSKCVVEDTVQIVFDSKFLMVVDQTPDEWAENLKTIENVQYIEVLTDYEKEMVTLTLTKAQKVDWIEFYEKLLLELSNKMSKENPAYSIQYSDDYTQIDFYYNLELDAVDAIHYVLYAETYCIIQQLFQGVDSDEWKVTANIYNSDTGKLVTTGDSDTGLSYEEEDWKASE